MAMLKSLVCRRMGTSSMSSMTLMLRPFARSFSSSAAAAAASSRPLRIFGSSSNRTSLFSTKLKATSPASLFVRLGHGHSTGAANSESKGPGSVTGSVAEIIDQGTGIEHEELVLADSGYKRFDFEEGVDGEFGTVAKPVQVPSGQSSRYVLCVGGGVGALEHVGQYFVLHKGPKTACPECGQVFQLVDSTVTAEVGTFGPLANAPDAVRVSDAELAAIQAAHAAAPTRAAPADAPAAH